MVFVKTGDAPGYTGYRDRESRCQAKVSVDREVAPLFLPQGPACFTEVA
jgi:hypothetical protein